MIKYFTAGWGGPCQVFKPVMEQLKSEGHPIQILDVDANQQEAQQYGVRAVPTCIVLDSNNNIKETLVGVQTKERVLESLNG